MFFFPATGGLLSHIEEKLTKPSLKYCPVFESQLAYFMPATDEPLIKEIIGHPRLQ